jgi:hypothetical protein
MRFPFPSLYCIVLSLLRMPRLTPAHIHSSPDFSGKPPHPSMACKTHNFNLCGNCATPARLGSHHQARHFFQPMTWDLYLIRTHPQISGGPSDSGSAFSVGRQYNQPRDEGNGITEHRVGGQSFRYMTPTVTSSQSTFDAWIAANGGIPYSETGPYKGTEGLLARLTTGVYVILSNMFGAEWL